MQPNNIEINGQSENGDDEPYSLESVSSPLSSGTSDDETSESETSDDPIAIPNETSVITCQNMPVSPNETVQLIIQRIKDRPRKLGIDPKKKAIKWFRNAGQRNAVKKVIASIVAKGKNRDKPKWESGGAIETVDITSSDDEVAVEATAPHSNTSGTVTANSDVNAVGAATQRVIGCRMHTGPITNSRRSIHNANELPIKIVSVRSMNPNGSTEFLAGIAPTNPNICNANQPNADTKSNIPKSIYEQSENYYTNMIPFAERISSPSTSGISDDESPERDDDRPIALRKPVRTQARKNTPVLSQPVKKRSTKRKPGRPKKRVNAPKKKAIKWFRNTGQRNAMKKVVASIITKGKNRDQNVEDSIDLDAQTPVHAKSRRSNKRGTLTSKSITETDKAAANNATGRTMDTELATGFDGPKQYAARRPVTDSMWELLKSIAAHGNLTQQNVLEVFANSNKQDNAAPHGNSAAPGNRLTSGMQKRKKPLQASTPVVAMEVEPDVESDVEPELERKLKKVIMRLQREQLGHGSKAKESTPSLGQSSLAGTNANNASRTPPISDVINMPAEPKPLTEEDIDMDIDYENDFHDEIHAQFPQRQNAVKHYIDKYREHLPHIEHKIARIHLEVNQLTEAIQQKESVLDRLKYLRDVKVELYQRMNKIRKIIRMREMHVDNASFRQLKEFEVYLSKPNGDTGRTAQTATARPEGAKSSCAEELIELMDKRAAMNCYQLERERSEIERIEKVLQDENLLPKRAQPDSREPPNFEGIFSSSYQFEDPKDYYTECRPQQEQSPPRPLQKQRDVIPMRVLQLLKNEHALGRRAATPPEMAEPINTAEQKANEIEVIEMAAEVYHIRMPDTPSTHKRRRTETPATDHGPTPKTYMKKCNECDATATRFLCAGCRNRWYCSRECQINAWVAHSENCPGTYNQNNSTTGVENL